MIFTHANNKIRLAGAFAAAGRDTVTCLNSLTLHGYPGRPCLEARANTIGMRPVVRAMCGSAVAD